MSRRGENIYLRKDGRWEGRYIKGRKRCGKAVFGYVYGRKYTEVKSTLIRMKALFAEVPKEEKREQTTFHTWAHHWLQTECKPYVKPGTYWLYQRNLSLHLLPALGTLFLHEVGEEILQQLALTLQEKLAPSTVAGIFRLLRAILRAAHRKGFLKGEPPTVKLRKPAVSPPRVLTCTEQRKLESASLRSGEPAILIALYTGLRVGELCGMKWADVDLHHHVLTVQRTASRIRLPEGGTQTGLAAPKTEGSVRAIPFPAFLSSVLTKLPRKNEFVFPGENGNCLDVRSMQYRLEHLAKKEGLSGIHMHTLRHTYATRCLEKQIGVETLSALLGHSSPAITLRYYAHTTLEQKKHCIRRLRPMASLAVA